MVAMMWRVSPAFPGILSVIGFSGSGLVFLSVVSLNTNMYVASYTTQASSRWSKKPERLIDTAISVPVT